MAYFLQAFPKLSTPIIVSNRDFAAATLTSINLAQTIESPRISQALFASM